MTIFCMGFVLAANGYGKGADYMGNPGENAIGPVGENGSFEDHPPTIPPGRYTNAEGDMMDIENGQGIKLRVRNVTAHADMNLSLENETMMNRTRIRANLSNGRNAEIKIMPSTASERAIEMLRIHVCTLENNCTIVLKELGKNNETRASYEINATKEYRLFGFLKTKARVQAHVDAESGNVTQERRPWWSFMASED